MNEPLTAKELRAIFTIIFAMADDFFVTDPADLGPLDQPDTWRKWIQQNGSQAKAFLLALETAVVFDDVARQIAQAHANAALQIVGPPSEEMVRAMMQHLETIDQLVANNQAFKPALDVAESLANAVSAAGVGA